MNLNYYLSPHFRLREFLISSRSSSLNRENIDYFLNNAPLNTLHHLFCISEVLECVRDFYFQPITITSGYRCPNVNKEVGGVKNSYHLQGLAVDLRITPGLYEAIKDVIDLSIIPKPKEFIVNKNQLYIHLSFDSDPLTKFHL